MIIAGMVIDVKPEAGASVLQALRHRQGILEATDPGAPGRLAAVMEAPDNRAMEALVESLLTVDGVVAVNPAFIHFDA